jgi:hypothetical protein
MPEQRFPQAIRQRLCFDDGATNPASSLRRVRRAGVGQLRRRCLRRQKCEHEERQGPVCSIRHRSPLVLFINLSQRTAGSRMGPRHAASHATAVPRTHNSRTLKGIRQTNVAAPLQTDPIIGGCGRRRARSLVCFTRALTCAGRGATRASPATTRRPDLGLSEPSPCLVFFQSSEPTK